MKWRERERDVASALTRLVGCLLNVSVTLWIVSDVERETLEDGDVVQRRWSKLELGWEEERLVAIDGFADNVTCLDVGVDGEIVGSNED